jgi:alkaline phosphatase
LDNLASIENAYTAFNGPNYHVIGNHEFDDATRAEILPNLNNDDPNNPTLADGTYYSYDAGGLHCVVLDADYTNDPPHTPFEKDGGWNWKDAWIPQAEMDWLAADLAASDLPTVVFTHQVVHRDNTEAHTIKNADALQQLLVADGDVLAVFSGHDHSGEFVIEDDIAYIVMNGNVGISKNWQADLGVDGLDPVRDNQFALVEVTDLGDGSYRIDVDGYGFQTTYQNVVVPEPATMSLLALGGLAALRRRRNR